MVKLYKRISCILMYNARSADYKSVLIADDLFSKPIRFDVACLQKNNNNNFCYFSYTCMFTCFGLASRPNNYDNNGTIRTRLEFSERIRTATVTGHQSQIASQ